MGSIRHQNSGSCEKCNDIFLRYVGFYPKLRHWFENLQVDLPSAHISCAGRGRIDQEALFIRGATKARWGESAHNWNAAIDVFELAGDLKNIYEPKWYREYLAPRIPDWLTWYGVPGSSFFELPHIQVKDYRILAEKGLLSLVE